MKKFKLKTVDVWDTILRRDCHPDFIKRSTAYYFFLKYHFLHNVDSADQLFTKRVEVERSIGQRNKSLDYDDEYHIRDVMLQWVENYISAEQYDTLAIVHELYSWEINQEKKHIYLDPGIKDFLAQYPSDKTIFLSDFYTSSADLIELLHSVGLDKSVISDGISSIDERLNKRSGRLFDFVQQKYQLSVDDWVHIGDNEWSDVQMPASKGIKSIRYLPTKQHQLREQKEFLWSKNEELTETITNNILNDHVASKNLPLDFQLGLKTTPLIAGFCLKILEQAIISKSEKIFFFTREGEFFIKSMSILISHLKANIAELELPEIDILEVSRLATFAPSLQEISLKEMMRIWNLYSTQSINSLFKTLNVEPEIFQIFIEKYGIPADEQIQYPWLDSRIQKLFDDYDFKEKLWQHVIQQRALLQNYFMTKGLTDDVNARVSVVDVGWRGTIHDNIALLYPNIHFTGIYLGLQNFLNEQPLNTSKVAFGPDLNRLLEYPHFLDSVAPIEMITNSPSGSVIGYGSEDGNIVVIRSINDDENSAWHNFTKTFQEGILAGMESFSSKVLDYGLTHDIIRSYALNVWDVLISGKNQSLIDAFHNLNHNETFGLGGYIKKRHVPSSYEILSSLWNKNNRAALIEFIKANQWSDGIRKRDDLPWLNKKTLAMTIDLAIFYKRNFHRKY